VQRRRRYHRRVGINGTLAPDRLGRRAQPDRFFVASDRASSTSRRMASEREVLSG
jgi:hypothetical protein